MSYTYDEMCECGGRFGDHFAGRNQCPRREGVFRLVEPVEPNDTRCECGYRFGEHSKGSNRCPTFFRPAKPDPWHPASQPPNNDRRVLVFVPSYRGQLLGRFENLYPRPWVIEGNRFNASEVTHWRELPEPPKGGTV